MRIRRVIVAAVGLMGVVALTGGSAFASGGPSGGGGGGGGAGGGGGGGATATTATPPSSCAPITSFSNSTGYYSVWAAIWTPFSVSDSCGYAVDWQMTYTNGTSGAVDFVRSGSTAYMSGGTIDEDWAALSTTYTVALTVTGPNGIVMDTRSAVVTTKQPKTGA
jgi:hypothetical protein